MDGNSEKFCPLCANEMDWTDKQFEPCPCGYQICIWCWHHIMEEVEGHSKARCPACTLPYDKDKIPNVAISIKSLAGENSKRKQKSKKENQKLPEDRSYLSNCRLIRRDVVFLSGIPLSLANEKMLQKNQFLGQYGKVLKAIPLKDLNSKQESSSSSVCSIYVTFLREEDALRCILSVNGFILKGYPLRACYGTSKYCHTWMNNLPCRNRDCVYSHDHGRKEDICSKDDVVSSCLSKVQECAGISLNSLPRRQGSCFPPPVDLSKIKHLNKDMSRPVLVPNISIEVPQSNGDNHDNISGSHSRDSREVSCTSKPLSSVAPTTFKNPLSNEDNNYNISDSHSRPWGASSTSRPSSSVTPVTFSKDLQSVKENDDDFSESVLCVSRGTSDPSRPSSSAASRPNLSSCPVFSTTLQNQLPVSQVMTDISFLRSRDKKVIGSTSTSTSARLFIKDMNEAGTKVTNYVGKYTLFSNDDAMMETRKILKTLSKNSSSLPFDIVQDIHETSLAASCSIHSGPSNPAFSYGSVSLDRNRGNLTENWQNLQNLPDATVSEHEDSLGLGTSYHVSYAPLNCSVDVINSSNFHSEHTLSPSPEYNYTSLDTRQLLDTNQDKTTFLQETRHFDLRINSSDTFSEHFEDLTDMYCQNSYLGYNLLSSFGSESSSEKIGSDTLNMLDLKGPQLSHAAYEVQSSTKRNTFNHIESFSSMFKDAAIENIFSDDVSFSFDDVSVKQHLGGLIFSTHERMNSCSKSSNSLNDMYNSEPMPSFSVMNNISEATGLSSSTKVNCSWRDSSVKQFDTSRESRIHLCKVQKDSTFTGLQSLKVNCSNQGDVSCPNAAKESCSLQNLHLSASAPRPTKTSNLSTPPGFTVPTIHLATQRFSNCAIVGE